MHLSSVFLSVHPSVISLSIYHPSTSLCPICGLAFDCLSVCLSGRVIQSSDHVFTSHLWSCIRLSVCLSVRPSVHPWNPVQTMSFCPICGLAFICLSVRPSIHGIHSSDYVFTPHLSPFLLVGRTLQELQTALGISFERLFKYMLLGPRASSKNAPSPHGVCHSVLTARIIDTGLEQHEHRRLLTPSTLGKWTPSDGG